MLLQNGNIYYYITNAQGDVIRLVDINGNVAASYRYDPYGKATSALGSHANINPLRYRGYVFDVETGLYYLQSRYYDPETGRFLNADALASTGQGLLGYNMFAYCLNNPVCRKDVPGSTSQEIFEDDGNPTDDDKDIAGGKMSNGGSGGSGGTGGSVNSVSPIFSPDAVSNYQAGQSQAPPQNPPGTVYTQLSADGNNTVLSQTVYGEYGMSDFRIDYFGHTHGNMPNPHIHLFYVYVGPNGTFLNNGPVVPLLM